jgi:ribosomal protein S21
MPIVIKKNGKNDSTRDLIRRFKKTSSAIDVVDRARERQYHVTEAQKRKEIRDGHRRLKKKIRQLKQMKNIPPRVIERLTERLAEE